MVSMAAGETKNGNPLRSAARIFEGYLLEDEDKRPDCKRLHHYIGQPGQLAKCIETVLDWSARKKLLA